MLKSRENALRRQLAAGAVGGLAVAGLCAALLAGAGGAAGAAPAKTTVVLGATPTTPNPNCPDICRGIVSSTGFQISNEQGRLPFLVPFDGLVTAWTLTLGQPTNAQRAFFNNRYGRPPEAHLAILKRVPRSDPPSYRLLRQSTIRVLSPYLGRTVKFKLGRQLPVRRNNIIALSVPTWAPAFADGLDTTNQWRASRLEGQCGAGSSAKGRPQQLVNSKREYGCHYETARLLYTATVVKSR